MSTNPTDGLFGKSNTELANLSELDFIAFAKRPNLSEDEVDFLINKNPYNKAKRVLARNIYIDRNTLAKLAFYPVENISYMAVKNPNCDINRTFRVDLPCCVTCEVDEAKLSCPCSKKTVQDNSRAEKYKKNKEKKGLFNVFRKKWQQTLFERYENLKKISSNWYTTYIQSS